MSVSLLIGPLCLDNCHIRVERGHHCHFSIPIGAFNKLNLLINTWHVRAKVASQREEREASCSGNVAPYHAIMGVFFKFKWSGNVFFDGTTKAMQWANAGVAQVAEHHLPRYACRHHLIVDQVRRHPNQRQVAAVLANDLMSSGKTDEGSKAFNSNRHPVMDILGDRLFQRESFICHIRLTTISGENTLNLVTVFSFAFAPSAASAFGSSFAARERPFRSINSAIASARWESWML